MRRDDRAIRCIRTARLALTILAVAAAGLGGCRGQEVAKRLRPLIVASPAEALTLDPAAITDAASTEVAMQIFEPLVRQAISSPNVEAVLASRWRVSDGGRLWTFHLRRGVRFHDGTPMTADAVVFSFERQRDQSHAYHFQKFPYWENNFRNVLSVKKIDRYTVQIRIARPYAPFLDNLGLLSVSIVSPAALRKHGKAFAKAPVGTGPFRFVRWDRGAQIVLERNRHYWGPKPKVGKLVYRVIGDARQLLASLQSGAVDVINGLAPDSRHIVRLHPDLLLRRLPGNNVAYLAMHTGRPPFDNVRVRRAVNHAVNKNAIVKLVYQGLATPARGPIPPSMWSYSRGARTYEYDPARAQQLLRQAGYDFSRRVRLLTMTSPRSTIPAPVLVARMIARDLQAVGMRVELVARPHGEHLRSIHAGEHHLCLHAWIGDNTDPDNFLYTLLDRDNAQPGTALNVAFFSDEQVHRLLLKGQAETDRAARERYYRQAQRIIAEQAPWVPLAHTEVLVAHRRAVHGLRVHPSSTVLYHRVEAR